MVLEELSFLKKLSSLMERAINQNNIELLKQINAKMGSSIDKITEFLRPDENESVYKIINDFRKAEKRTFPNINIITNNAQSFNQKINKKDFKNVLFLLCKEQLQRSYGLIEIYLEFRKEQIIVSDSSRKKFSPEIIEDVKNNKKTERSKYKTKYLILIKQLMKKNNYTMKLLSNYSKGQSIIFNFNSS